MLRLCVFVGAGRARAGRAVRVLGVDVVLLGAVRIDVDDRESQHQARRNDGFHAIERCHHRRRLVY